MLYFATLLCKNCHPCSFHYYCTQ